MKKIFVFFIMSLVFSSCYETVDIEKSDKIIDEPPHMSEEFLKIRFVNSLGTWSNTVDFNKLSLACTNKNGDIIPDYLDEPLIRINKGKDSISVESIVVNLTSCEGKDFQNFKLKKNEKTEDEITAIYEDVPRYIGKKLIGFFYNGKKYSAEGKHRMAIDEDENTPIDITVE